MGNVVKWEKLPLFDALNFDFSYDEEQRTCSITAHVNEWMLNPLGTVHGGMYVYLADTAMGHALHHFEKDAFVALDLNSHFYEGKTEGKLTATASVVKRGYKICFMKSEVRDEAGVLVAEVSGSFYRKKAKTNG
ncbi:MAG TPA: PaaI family thioesterase [Chondromyces sp.]|nr:PaaI family thioesterase [Chondromyces sp.]